MFTESSTIEGQLIRTSVGIDVSLSCGKCCGLEYCKEIHFHHLTMENSKQEILKYGSKTSSKLAGDLKKLIFGVVAILLLTPFELSSVSAKTYEIVSIGAIHEEIVSLGVYNLVVTPIYATDVFENMSNGTLSFKVLPNLYAQLLGASTNISDISRPLNALPILKFLQENDSVVINFKDCKYTQNSVERIPSTDNYEIRYSGQANSVIINATAIPELPEISCLTISVAVIMVISTFLIRKTENNRRCHPHGKLVTS